MSVHFSSKSDLWSTPLDLFEKLNSIHNFTLDACAIPENAKCLDYFSPEQNGLKQQWTGVVWCNPPYGKEIKKWIEKGFNSARNGVKVVMLIPARTDTAYWHDFVMRGKIEFLRGRLKFGDAKNSAPFPSAIVIFEYEKNKPTN